MPKSRDSYIHRVGRTGRAGKTGDATIILAPFEKGFLEQLHDIPIKEHQLPESELKLGKKEEKIFDIAYKVVPDGMIEEAYVALLGYCTILN
jgi:ATP-dependent RNA helicase MSS116, mitochondrial